MSYITRIIKALNSPQKEKKMDFTKLLKATDMGSTPMSANEQTQLRAKEAMEQFMGMSLDERMAYWELLRDINRDVLNLPAGSRFE